MHLGCGCGLDILKHLNEVFFNKLQQEGEQEARDRDGEKWENVFSKAILERWESSFFYDNCQNYLASKKEKRKELCPFVVMDHTKT